ncbi:MAG: CHAT domain-containing protein, partial [Planctomycetota bacterium]
IDVCVYYKNILLQHLVCEARVHDADDEWNENVSLVDWAARGKAMQQEAKTLTDSGVSNVADLARKSDLELFDVGVDTKIEIDTLLSMRDALLRLLGARESTDLGDGRPLQPLGNETTVVYSINPTFVAFDEYEDSALCVTLGETGRNLHVKAGEESLHCEIDPNLKNSSEAFRKLLSDATEPKPKEYGFPGNEGEEPVLKKLLLRMAILGQDIFAATFTNLEIAKRVRELLDAPSIITTTQASPELPIVPWNGLYDLKLAEDWEEDAGQVRRTACMKFRETSHQKKTNLGESGPEDELDFETCIGQTDCPRRRQQGQSEDDYNREVRCTVCVFGFWGYKHQVQSPPGGLPEPTQETATAVGLPAYIEFASLPKVQIIANSEIESALPHQRALSRLHSLPTKPDIHTAVTANDIEQSLRDKASHVVYFLCHGDVSANKHCVLVGKNDVRISATTLLNWEVEWQHAPLVVINGCETVGNSEKAIANLALAFRARKASGIVGTETKVFSELARWFGENFMKQFLLGHRVGDVMLKLRLALLQKGNPLGLIYTTYSMGGLKLIQRDA